MFVELIIYPAGATRTFDRTMKEAAAMKASPVFFEERNSVRCRGSLWARVIQWSAKSFEQIDSGRPIAPANASFVPRQSIVSGNVSRPTFAELEEYACTNARLEPFL